VLLTSRKEKQSELTIYKLPVLSGSIRKMELIIALVTLGLIIGSMVFWMFRNKSSGTEEEEDVGPGNLAPAGRAPRQ
jgi:hypothetical protein